MIVLAITTIAIQCGVWLSLLALKLPTTVNLHGMDLFLKHREGISAEYELLFYRLSIVFTCVMTLIIFVCLRKHVEEKITAHLLKRFIFCNVFWLLFQTFFIFKYFLPQPLPYIEVYLFCVSLGQILTWLFFPEVNRLFDVIKNNNDQIKQRMLYPYCVDIVMLASLVFFLNMSKEVIYFSLTYVVFRMMFQRPLLALAMNVCAIKWGLFHWGANLILYWWSLCGWVLIIAATGTFISHKLIKKLIIVVGILLIVCGIINGPWVSTDLKLLAPLKNRHFGAFMMSFFVPIVYTGICFLGVQSKIQPRGWIISGIASLGLIEYVQFLSNPVIYGFFASGWVWAFCIGVVIVDLMDKFFLKHRRALEILLVFLSYLFLLTNRLWLIYPRS